eukprot:3341160-Pleurochrysis_carterae.AAC.2
MKSVIDVHRIFSCTSRGNARVSVQAHAQIPVVAPFSASFQRCKSSIVLKYEMRISSSAAVRILTER